MRVNLVDVNAIGATQAVEVGAMFLAELKKLMADD